MCSRFASHTRCSNLLNILIVVRECGDHLMWREEGGGGGGGGGGGAGGHIKQCRTGGGGGGRIFGCTVPATCCQINILSYLISLENGMGGGGGVGGGGRC